ncbi:MAG TPA: thioesterase domain-containing protein, partial [Candidatus Hydrogenedentes bacterium]|nr:thioesterase domain-containing protein [Candidatus Hydrogenedentota bacterium]
YIHHARGIPPDSTPAESSSIIRIHGSGSNPPLFVPHDLSGDVGFARHLSKYLGPDQPVYGFHNTWGSSASERGRSMEELASGYIEDLIQFQPGGRYCLAGYSFSGYLAYEIARQLQLRGKSVLHLAVIDAGPPLPKPVPVTLALAGSLAFLKNVPLWVWDDLLKCPHEEMVRRIRRKANQTRKGLRKAFSAGIRAGLDKDVGDIFALDRLPEEVVARMEFHLKILNAYNPGPYSGSFTLYRARTQPLLRWAERDLGWSRLVGRDFQIIKISGSHESIGRDPQIRLVADALRTSMNKLKNKIGNV